MQNDAVTLVSWRSRPRSFVALMSLYESNYLRLGWLTASQSRTGLLELNGSHRSVVREDCDLLLDVTERTPYTTTLNLTYRFGTQEFPDMGVRIYHDARLVEALEWAGAHANGVLQALRRNAERELDQRWARNVMLNKWLEYCLERGHRFSSATLIPVC
jgi:uncharacterized protein YqiB (DUF1249 family)